MKLRFLLIVLLLTSCFRTSIEDEHAENNEFECPLPINLPSAIGSVENPFQGDILIKNQTKQAGAISALWDDKIIPIFFDTRWYENSDRLDKVKQAFQYYEDNLGFTFVEYTEASEFFVKDNGVYIKYAGVAASYIGKQGGIQDMYLPASWNSLYSTSLHEIGHLVGLHHPHVTEKQDEWLTIYWDNIPEEKHSFFMTYKQYDENYGGGNYKGQREGFEYADEYDIYSIMNYSSFANAIDTSKPTMTLKDGTIFEPSETLSTWDKISINRMYKCYEQNKLLFELSKIE